MRTFYYIFIEPNTNIKYAQIKKEMDKALDWFQISTNNWIVYSSSDIERWMQRLANYVKKDGSLFITKLDLSDNNGWMTIEFWEWLNKHLDGKKEKYAGV